MKNLPIIKRMASIDAYRGFVMLLMMGEVLSFDKVSKALPNSGFWHFLAWHQSHVEWVGCSLHDLVHHIEFYPYFRHYDFRFNSRHTIEKRLCTI